MLQLNNIAKSYQAGQVKCQALSGVNLQIKHGEMVALCGPSGSGKSTLLSICGLLDLAYQGELYFDGEHLHNNAHHCMLLRRQQLGFIFQRFNLVPVMSAYENVEYPLLLNKMSAATRRKKVLQILDAVGMSSFTQAKPECLSGGQQQRVAIARALVHQPRLVIADEPTASLDSVSAHQVIELMKSIGKAQQTTFVIATHDSRMSLHCERQILLHDGQIQSGGDRQCVA